MFTETFDGGLLDTVDDISTQKWSHLMEEKKELEVKGAQYSQVEQPVPVKIEPTNSNGNENESR